MKHIRWVWLAPGLTALAALAGCPPLPEPGTTAAELTIREDAGPQPMQGTTLVRLIDLSGGGLRSGATVGFLAWRTDAEGEPLGEAIAGSDWTHPGGAAARFTCDCELAPLDRLTVESHVVVQHAGRVWRARPRVLFSAALGSEYAQTVTVVFPDDFRADW